MSIIFYDSDSPSSSNDDNEASNVHVPDLSGLSPEALAALQWHFAGCPPDQVNDDNNGTMTSSTTLETPSTPQLDTVNDMMKRLKAADAIKEAAHQGNLHDNLDATLKTNLTARCSTIDKIGSDAAIQRACCDLLENGVVRLNNCLSANLCDATLAEVNRQMDALEPGRCGERSREDGFGSVLARKCRYDAYQRPTGSFQQALVHMLGGGDGDGGTDTGEEKGNATEDEEDDGNTQQLRKLFEALFGGIQDAPFMELSVLISDPGAPRQQLHPDNEFQPVCPLYTVFIALQDVTLDMGPTVFLPRTNTKQCHADFNDGRASSQRTEEGENEETKAADWFLKSREWSTMLLKKGDVQVLDSMTLHAATANISDQRRALLYFTLRNPKCVDFGKPSTPSITEGSLYKDVNICLADYSKTDEQRVNDEICEMFKSLAQKMATLLV